MVSRKGTQAADASVAEDEKRRSLVDGEIISEPEALKEEISILNECRKDFFEGYLI